MMDIEHEANTQGDSGATLRQHQPQGSTVATVLLTYTLLIIQCTSYSILYFCMEKM